MLFGSSHVTHCVSQGNRLGRRERQGHLIEFSSSLLCWSAESTVRRGDDDGEENCNGMTRGGTV